MSDIKICDRCGKRIDKGMARIWIGLAYYRLLDERFGSKTHNDLCFTCKKEFEKFMAGEATEAVSNA